MFTNDKGPILSKKNQYAMHVMAWISLLILPVFCGKTSANSSGNADLRAEINALKAQLNRLESKLSPKKVSTQKNTKAPQKKKQPVISLMSPDKKIRLNGITLTPGGFLAGEGVWRSRNQQSDMASSFNTIPLGNNPLAYMNELRFSARQSRISTLIEGNVNPSTVLSGYAEIDFLGNGTANQNESNSFNPRLRNLYAAFDQNDLGWHVLAGQSWSLATTYSKGLMQRDESPPPTIDAQYVVGFVWKRQPQFRLTKNFGKTVWAAISAEYPQTTFAGIPLPGNGVTPIYNNVVAITNAALGSQSLPAATSFSINHIPDVIVKLAYEPTISGHKLHFEGFGIYRDLYDRVEYLKKVSTNWDTPAGGVGAGMVLEVIPKRLDFQGSMLAGNGIGSYSSGLMPDATISSNGALIPIPEVVFMLGATLHATDSLDLYVFGGSERETATYFFTDKKYFGYGVPTANNSGCNIVNTGICAGDSRNLWQVTTGLWDKFYQGPFGDLRGGLQYSYTVRTIFPGTGGETSAIPVGYNTNENMVLFSLRYYPFTIANVAPG